MTDESVDETTDDVKRVDEDTEQNADPGGAVEGHGVGDSPTDSHDTDENQDPKSGHSPV
jgi:hypothetical protein